MNFAKTVAVLISAAIIIVAGCKTEKLTNNQLVGTWSFDASKSGDAKPAYTAATFSLESTGAFLANSMPPGFAEIQGLKQTQAISGTGTWKLVAREDQARLRLTFTHVEGNNGQGLPYGGELFVEQSGSAEHLFYSEGDPDQNQRVYFQRKPTIENTGTPR